MSNNSCYIYTLVLRLRGIYIMCNCVRIQHVQVCILLKCAKCTENNSSYCSILIMSNFSQLQVICTKVSKCEELQYNECLGVSLPYTHTSTDVNKLHSQRAAKVFHTSLCYALSHNQQIRGKLTSPLFLE